MKCPICEKQSSALYKCDKCGNVRCGHTMHGGCANLKGPYQSSFVAANGKLCPECKKGHFQKI